MEECGKTRLHCSATFASDCNKNRHLSSGRAGWEEGSEKGEGVVVVWGNRNPPFSWIIFLDATLSQNMFLLLWLYYGLYVGSGFCCAWLRCGNGDFMIRYEPWQIEALFKGCSLSGVYLRTMMEFKSTSISAVHLSLSCASLSLLTKDLWKHPPYMKWMLGVRGGMLEVKEELRRELRYLKGIQVNKADKSEQWSGTETASWKH